MWYKLVDLIILPYGNIGVIMSPDPVYSKARNMVVSDTILAIVVCQ